jgi:hypothetical protein
MSTATKLQAAIAALLLLGSVSSSAFAEVVLSRYLDQPVLVFNTEDVRNHRIPARIHEHGAPLVFGSQVSLACLGVNLGRDELAVYLPESQTCIPLGELDPGNILGFERDRSALLKVLDKSAVAVMKPQAQAQGGAGLCNCPGNRPPVVSVKSGSPQEAIAGAAITSIEFTASDVDSEVLTEFFSFTLNGSSKKLGLPSGLVENCVSGSGTLSCTVSGSAPLTVGTYLILLEVSDGFSLGSATATLTTTAPPSEQIFVDGFENKP